MDEKIESEIILECKSGKNESFGELYNLYVKKIYNFVYFKTLHKQTAEDLTSEIFFKALKNIGKFDSNKKFSPWLYRIAKNTIIDHFRTFKTEENIEDIWDLEDDTDIENNVDDALTFIKAKKHLKTLSKEQRQIVIMRIWHEMSYKEIAQLMNKNEGNCKVIFSRAISGIRGELLVTLIIIFMSNFK